MGQTITNDDKYTLVVTVRELFSVTVKGKGGNLGKETSSFFYTITIQLNRSNEMGKGIPYFAQNSRSI